MPSFLGTWTGTWELDAGHSGTTTLEIDLLGVPNPGYHLNNAPLVNTAGPSNSTLNAGFGFAGDVINGLYMPDGNPTIDVTGGQLTLSQDGNTITGTVEIGHSADIALNLTRVP